MEVKMQGVRLSPQQKHCWTLQCDNRNFAYRAQCAVRLDGPLSTPVLNKAIEQVVKRHEILRTTFHLLPGMSIPVQVIGDSKATLERCAVSDGLDGRAREAEVERLFQVMRRRSFAFEQGPLLSASLMTFSDIEQVLLITLPALCADTMTLKNLVREIGQAYAACLREEELPGLPIQYSDLSEIFNELLESDETEAGRQYWQQHDLSSLFLVRLPFEKRPYAAQDFEPQSMDVQIEPETVAKLRAVAGEHASGAISALLLTCWQTLLWRLTGESDLIVGAAYDGRVYEGVEDALGLFTRYLPVRLDIEASRSFVQMLKSVEQLTNEIHEWQEYFKLEQWRSPTGEATEATFFPYSFSFEQHPTPSSVGGVTFSLESYFACPDRFNINLRCIEKHGSISTEFHYDSALYTSAQVRQLAAQFHRLLKSVAQTPQAAPGELEISSTDERQLLLSTFNRTDADYPQDRCIHEIFQQQVQRTPDRVAVAFEEQQFTYAGLDARANQLAHRLEALGVGAETRVGLCVARSPDMLIGILGILKAGGAYVPLEPTAPPDRLAFILNDAGVSVIVTQRELGACLPEHGAQVVYLDSLQELPAQASETNAAHRVRPENLAYIIYTSGSTGRPKGVMIQHRSALNLASALSGALYEGQVSPLRVSLNAPLTFDASVKQLLQLLHGHTILILPEEVRASPEKLLSFIQQHALEVLDCTPSQLKPLLAAGLLSQPDKTSLVFVLVGGEALDERLWETLAEHRKPAFINVYGPTECTVDATLCRVHAEPEHPCIGRPIANTQLYILNSDLTLLPLGAAGEIYLSGAGLARGYVQQPGLTAERFVPHPFGAQPGTLLYRTGDRACYLPDGRVKFLGRIDHQVKVRGVRIEPGEIEAVMLEHPAVQEAVVLLREVTPGEEQQLVGYVVPVREPAPSNGYHELTALQTELRAFLRTKLPEYMVPSFIVLLPELPATPNGKLNREALPIPQLHAPALQVSNQPPRNQIERTVAGIWQEVLQVEDIGIHDNFFDLGGHSLLLVQVFDKLQATFGKKLSMVEMFRHPTISTLADYIRRDEPDTPDLNGVDELVQKQKAARERQRQRMEKDKRRPEL
jgi:amino acid adenylation domain-containing protein